MEPGFPRGGQYSCWCGLLMWDQGTGVRKVGHAEEGPSLLSPPSVPAVVLHHV